MRQWLAEALRTPADALPLERGTRGRPRLGAPLHRTDVNWSHSGDGLLMARGDELRLGVDLELLRPRPRALEVANRYFAARECARLAALPESDRDRAFTRLWCAKEAVLKAHGRGLAFGLDKLVFDADGDTWVLVDCDPALGTPLDWALHHFEPAPGYLAALAWRAATPVARPTA